MYTASFIVALFTSAKGVIPQRPISKQTDKQTVAWPYHATSFGQKEERVTDMGNDMDVP